ncbi:hypothetical protein SteCoe_12292 [Stentor coeruleus]|uniref:RanBP2-type domain-containing protein n=1 Tax=Stentor coeruleus TaxID=5963 RepID=A0A1R2CB46_9CILI|nr:hypothetical protein SteCoe_12292 [Stentor coeruleus]
MMVNNRTNQYSSSPVQKNVRQNYEKNTNLAKSADFSMTSFKFTFTPSTKFTHFAEAVKIMYILKDFRFELIKSNTCDNDNCISILCILKKVFNDISFNCAKTGQNADLRPLQKVIEKKYLDFSYVESVLDAISIFIHAISNESSCSNKNLQNLLKSSLIENYKCQCSSSFISKIDNIFFFTIDISEPSLTTYNFINIKKILDSQNQYKICNKSKCPLKKSIKVDCIKIAPIYLIFKITYKIPSYKLKNHSIPLSFATKELFLCDKNDSYNLSLIVITDNANYWSFFNQQKKWYGNDDKVLEFPQIIEFINERNLIVDMIVYEKENQSSNRRSGHEEVKREMGAWKNLVKKETGDDIGSKNMWKCEICANENYEIHDICTKCASIRKGKSGWVCGECKFLNPEGEAHCQICDPYIPSLYLSEHITTDFTDHTCPKCKNKVKNGQNCKICLQNSVNKALKSDKIARSMFSSNEKDKKCPKCGMSNINDLLCICSSNKPSLSEKNKNIIKSPLKSNSPIKEFNQSRARTSMKNGCACVHGNICVMHSNEKIESRNKKSVAKSPSLGNVNLIQQFSTSPDKKTISNKNFKRN